MTDEPMTDEKCKRMIMACGVSTNPLKGIVGTYYTTDRERDLIALVRAVLLERADE